MLLNGRRNAGLEKNQQINNFLLHSASLLRSSFQRNCSPEGGRWEGTWHAFSEFGKGEELGGRKDVRTGTSKCSYQ